MSPSCRSWPLPAPPPEGATPPVESRVRFPAMTSTDQIPRRIEELMPEIRDALERLVRIPSVSFPEFDPANVRRSAELTRELLEAAGMETEILEVEGAHPAVLGRIPGPDGAPTVLLYA